MSGKSIVDRIIQLWVWFLIGFTIVAVAIGLLNFAMNIVIMVTVKGFYIPSWALVAIAFLTGGICTAIGLLFERYDIQTRIQSYQNRRLNPEVNKLNQIERDVKSIKDWLGVEE